MLTSVSDAYKWSYLFLFGKRVLFFNRKVTDKEINKTGT
jgi:hypothetical protein